MIWGEDKKGSVQEADETQGKDLWFWYRAAAGVLTAIFGISTAWMFLAVGSLLAIIVEMFSSRSPVTFSGPDWGEFGPSFLLMAAVGLFVFGHAGYAFALNSNKGRKRVWVASILGLPVGVYGIWVLLRTRPGTNNPPPEKQKTALVAAGGIAIFMLVSTLPSMFTNHRIQKLPRQPEESDLIGSIRWNGEAQLQQLLENGADPNAPSHHGVTPLMIALNEIPHYRKLAPILLEHGADPNTPSWRSNYRRLVSPRANEMEVHEVDMRLLVESYRKQTPIVVATRHGDLELIKLMIAKGADVNARQSWKDLEMPLVDLMIKRGARNYAPQLLDAEPSALEVAADNLHEEAFFLPSDSNCFFSHNIPPFIISPISLTGWGRAI